MKQQIRRVRHLYLFRRRVANGAPFFRLRLVALFAHVDVVKVGALEHAVVEDVPDGVAGARVRFHLSKAQPPSPLTALVGLLRQRVLSPPPPCVPLVVDHVLEALVEYRTDEYLAGEHLARDPRLHRFVPVLLEACLVEAFAYVVHGEAREGRAVDELAAGCDYLSGLWVGC